MCKESLRLVCHERVVLLFHAQQLLAKPATLILPNALNLKAFLFGQARKCFHSVFVGKFSEDGFALGKIDFEKYIDTQVDTSLSTDEIDWGQQKEVWLTYLDQLYEHIEKMLSKYIEAGKVALEYKDKMLNEESVGEYPVKKMHIKIKRNEVVFDPIGTNIIGAYGRVDMKGSHGTVKILLIDELSNVSEDQIVEREQERQATEMEENGHVITDLEWKIITPPPAVAFLDFNEDLFFDALMEILNA